MARAKLTDTSNDLMSDSGAVLWSFVKGEQLEYPLTLGFLDSVSADYTFEAVIVEALNVEGQKVRPTNIKQGGIQTVLNVRVPLFLGSWQPTFAYSRDQIVEFDGVYYTLLAGESRVMGTEPSKDPLWEQTSDISTVFIQFPMALGRDWEVQPDTVSDSYGFFEIRVTEPSTAVFPHTWKPVRGMVEIKFSPTDTVA